MPFPFLVALLHYFLLYYFYTIIIRVTGRCFGAVDPEAGVGTHESQPRLIPRQPVP